MMEHLIQFQWTIHEKACYLAGVILLSLVIRVLLAILSAFPLRYVEHMKWRDGFVGAIIGYISSPEKELRERSDFLAPFFLGLLELLAYPVLIATGALSVIGAWIAFKAVVQWNTWTKQRFTFNRFLLGNALVVMASYWLSYLYVVVPG